MKLIPQTTLIFSLCLTSLCSAQTPVTQLERLDVREGAGVSAEVRLIYRKGVDFIASMQEPSGKFSGGIRERLDETAAICALATMTFLSTGEDPNFGRYAGNIRSAIRYIIRRQNPRSGYIPNSMYVHGFSMLALAEAYGAVDEEMLWENEPEGKNNSGRSIGEALELAVRLAVTSQKKNPNNGWRYSPAETSADTSVVGAVLMGLLAARNAGIDVPDESIDKALNYMKSMTRANTGQVSYSRKNSNAGGASVARSSIACLVFSIGKRNEWPELEATRKYITSERPQSPDGWILYERYYKSQALFQADYEAWEKWNRQKVALFRDTQLATGQIGESDHGPVYSTSMSLLATALNFRLLPIYER